jgi:hypothetical protein
VTLSPARLLILLYALLTLLVLPYVAFASDVSLGSQSFFGLVVWTLLVWYLWRGSRTAWWVAVALDALMIVSLILMQPGLGPTPLFLLGVALAHLLILFSRPVRAHVRSPGTTRPASV